MLFKSLQSIASVKSSNQKNQTSVSQSSNQTGFTVNGVVLLDLTANINPLLSALIQI